MELTTKVNEKKHRFVRMTVQQKCKNQHKKNISKSYQEKLSTLS